ncbi:hypothetical protein L228DRAFT_239811 [Xylona heveae TC161]|uniref:ARID domain-containing protein n=1 Tax=Xylona heveae (strain CBS 132557 / TC161) TaxID=1328760 RepID=A0A165G8S2_XYLHT|nr:hypothetical protein L228DRAFT_239811 [Xylona heveae TC161]KZF21879.1 hypothetical protein L228DRAFT_239811 [Xylona heveae TC161]
MSSMNSNGVFNPAAHDPTATLSPAMLDPSTAFMQTPNAFDLNQQIQAQQLQQQRMQNGSARNPTGAFHTPVYNVNPIVPSKRTREDSIGASPRQTPMAVPGALPGSRSQTPQQMPFSTFATNPLAAQQIPAAPTPYQHLQHGAPANASPSPIMQNQHFRPAAAPPRMQTASPSPFATAAQGFGPQLSPSQPDHMSRVQTPQSAASTFVPTLPYGAGFGPPFNPQMAMSPAGLAPGSVPPQPAPTPTPNLQQPQPQPQPQPQQPQQQQGQQQQQQQQLNAQRMYQMRLQQQQQQLQANSMTMQGGRPQSAGPMPLGTAGTAAPMPNMPAAGVGGGAVRPMQAMMRPNNPEQFMKNLAQFMHANGRPLNMTPMVADRTINLMQLYATVMKNGGFKKVTTMGAWPAVAAALQFPPMQYPTAPQEIKAHYERNLMLYESTFWQMQRQKVMNEQLQNMQQSQPNMPGAGGVQPQMSPPKPIPQPTAEQPLPQSILPQESLPQTPIKQTVASPNNVRPTPMNGYVTPQQQAQLSSKPSSIGSSQHRTSLSRQLEMTPPPQGPNAQYPSPSPAFVSKPPSIAAAESPMVRANDQATLLPPPPPPSPAKQPARLPTNFEPKVRVLDTHGGVDVVTAGNLGTELIVHKPVVPSFTELGVIDIHALTMSIRSGLHAEVRLALDTLATLSIAPHFQLSLESCEDLVEALIDCAEDLMETLISDIPEPLESLAIAPYETVLRNCRTEVDGLQSLPPVESSEYELDRAVDKLICITTLLRNFSFYETNHPMLVDANVLKSVAAIINQLGTRPRFLRSNVNTLDVMKDLVTFLSNLAQSIELPGKEEALLFLHFLLSFGPSPGPTNPNNDDVIFSAYHPSIHRYLPPAVDCLAKLLARDMPNRTFFRAIFAAESTGSPPYELLTRAFGLAISPIPEHARGNPIPIVEARKPFLVQGLLAAEILASLTPGPDHNLAKSWLSSADGFSLSLLRLVCLLSTDRTPPNQRAAGRSTEQDAQAYGMITHRGMAVLQRLAEKVRNSDDLSVKLPVGILPKKESLLGALLTANIDGTVVRQLCAYAGLES